MSSDQVMEQAQEAIAHAHTPVAEAVEAQQPVASEETPRTIPEVNDDSIHETGSYFYIVPTRIIR